MNRSSNTPIIIGIVSAVIVCSLCACLALVLGGAFLFRFNSIVSPTIAGFSTPAPSPVIIRPTLPATPTVLANEASPTQVGGETTPQPLDTPSGPQKPNLDISSPPTDTLKILETSNVPIADLVDLAKRLQGKTNIPLTMTPPPTPFAVGAHQTFWASNEDTSENFQVNATLRYVSPHLYFWIEDGVSYNSSALKKLGDTFENKIYPTDREFFGSEWTPGVDDDVHLYILLARGLGSTIAGYYSSADEYPPVVHKYSNAHEMFDLNADAVNLSDNFTYGVLAHEFQHMIHWYRDRNETSWINEGFSELAAFLNGYDVGGFDAVYTSDPDLQLNDWPNDHNATPPHYGASFLFLDYFLNRFGENATKALVGDPLNGLDSVDDILHQTNAVDPLTKKPITADDVFADWVVASYLQDASVGDGRYTYQNYQGAPKPGATERIRTCPTQDNTRDVHQYGVDYILISCQGDYTIHFEGSTQVPVIPENPHSGSYAFWSNKGDESDMTLTHSFDFSNASGPLTLDYWTWYDIETNYDYVYVEASTDGQNWSILKTPSGTDTDPSGNSYGWGYTGESGNGPQWIKESVDLSQFAGKKVQIRFEYITDAAVNGEGFLLDDVSIPEINYSTDFEKDNGGWEPDGFVRIENVLPQTFRLSLITVGNQTSVQTISINPNITADVPVHIGGDVKQVVLVVSGTTRFTRQTAAYRFSIR